MAVGVLLTGTIVFAALGVAACVIFPFCTAYETENITKGESIQLTIVCISVATVCLWGFWISMYMHQMNPMILPERAVH
ncbi:unnamed protein product [Vitrella brassicaformis CCMP3155]|uniref:Uncharacterized protein n=1 Tax=Vitrella brassicaformis (strain CCMP3155) TaxID=1169540 RepID=A0A0G4FR17_VITBC|nr:unnamed protein product [Vitrella brassicaformis CCMP3155]|eukprot:CEM16666.1 unnamed protein product [Vitrella brassicaformis CCMP3155]